MTVVGTGPGHKDYLTALGAEKIKEASILVGGKRLLDTFSRPGQTMFVVDKNLKAVLEYINDNYKKQKLVVLVSGDTGLYSLASYLARNLPSQILEFIPGVSSVQLMFAKMKMPWQNALIISLHARSPQGVTQIVAQRNTVALFTDNIFTPRRVAEYLLEHGCPDLPVAVGINLSYKNERLLFTHLKELAKCNDEQNPAVMVINYE